MTIAAVPRRSRLRRARVNKPVVEPDGMGAYQARFTGQGGERHYVIAGFPSRLSAAQWLDEHLATGGEERPDSASTHGPRAKGRGSDP
jgi:hypothetical protein